MKHILLLTIGLSISHLAKSQTPFCGSDYLTTDPAAQALQQQLEQQAADYFHAHQPAIPDAPHAVLTIPVVVHIIHDNGPENIPDAQVQQAIAWLNAAYANSGYFDQGSGMDAGIQFCLAQRTPYGETTNGITRDQSTLTTMTQETQDVDLKSINYWESKQYLNVWLVRDICSSSAGCGVVGYAYRPEYHGNLRDGLVIEAQFFGAVQSQMSVAAHEIGHYMGLYHTFEGGCTNQDCLVDGDRICDTPPDQSTAAVSCGQTVNTCSTDTQSGLTTDQPDMTSNYLDYGDLNCLHNFTPGQAGRMAFYLNGIRHSLLDSKGCLPPCLAPVASAFAPSATNVAPGQTVTFTNASQNAATYQWSINGVPFSTVPTTTYVFTVSGTYIATLLAQSSNTILCGAATSQVVIQVACVAPVVSAFTASATIINVGQTVTFTNASQNAMTYQWSINGTPFSAATNATHTFLAPGTYTVALVAQANNTLFCNTDTSQNVIQVICPVIADFTVSNEQPTVNEPITLTNTSQNATVFAWSIDGVAQADTLTTVTFAQAGTYVIQLTAGDEVCQSSVQQEVFVKAPCIDETFQLQYSSETPYNYASGYATATLTDGAAVLISSRRQTYYDNFSMAKVSPAGIQVWRKTPAASTFNGYCQKVAATADGGFVLGINDEGNKKNYVAKFTTTGILEWIQSVQSTEYARIHDLKINANQEILVVGNIEYNFAQQPFFAKFGPSGSLIWAERFTQPAIGGRWESLAALSDGGLVGVGSQTNGRAQVARLNADGNVLWYKRLSIDSGGKFSDAVQGGSSIYLCGSAAYIYNWLLQISLDGQIGWSKSYMPVGFPANVPRQRIIWVDHGLTLVGAGYQDVSPNELQYKSFLARFDTAGTMLWNRNYAPAGGTGALNDLVARPGGYFVVGDITGNPLQPIAWLLKTDDRGFAGTCPTDSLLLPITDAPITQLTQAFLYQAALTAVAAALPMADLPATPTLLCEKACPTNLEICNNNLDDDSDGLFDCLDADCPCMEDVCHPNRNNRWYFGAQAGLDFSTEPPTIRTDGQTNGEYATATISDKQGKLLFYTDGVHVFNRFHQIMPHGTSPDTTTLYPSHHAIIIPYPGNTALYYMAMQGGFTTFYYALVDMRLDSGRGDVVGPAYFTSLNGSDQEMQGLTATRSCTFDGYWLAIYRFTTNKMLAYRIDQNGFQPNPVVSPAGGPESVFTTDIKFSPHSNQLARAASGDSIFLYSFDANGHFSTPQKFKTAESVHYTHSVEYSPAGRYLYVSGLEQNTLSKIVYQFDLEAGNMEDIANSRVALASEAQSNSFYALQLAPNGKIYMAHGSPADHTMDIIHRPDAAGLACQFQKSGIVLPLTTDRFFNGSPNCIASDFRQPHIAFPPNAPDSICTLNSPTNYYLKNVHCGVVSIQWSLVGLAGTLFWSLVHDSLYAQVTYISPGHGQLIITVFTACGQASDTLSVTVHAGFSKNLDLGPDRTVCDNGVFTFNAGNGFLRYRWQDGSTDSVLTTLLPGKYWVDVFDACENRQTDTVRVSIGSTSVLSLGPDVQQCAGLPMVFQRPAVFVNWQWLPITFLTCDTCGSIVADPATTTTWRVIAQTADGCLSLDTLHWQIVDTLLSMQDITICAGQTIDLYGVSLPADTTIQFLRPNPGLGCDTLLTVHTLGVEVPTATVQARICADQFFDFHGTLLPADTTAVFHLPGPGCDSVMTVEVAAFPAVTVSLPADTSLSIGASLTLLAVASGTEPLSFDWQPSTGLDCTDCLQPTANPLDTITYTLLMTDGNGCSARDSITLRVSSDCQILIPNAFTPNGDGNNDWFYPATSACVRTVRLWRVVNRWGQVVFERRNFEPNRENLGWDGQGQPSYVLVWMAELEYFDGRIEQRQGEVTLLR